MNAFKSLERLINVEDITTITTNAMELTIPETMELMKEVIVENLLDDLVFWTKDEKVVVEYVMDDWGDTDKELVSISLKPPKNLIKGTPESLVDTWKDPETGKYLPFKTEPYLEKLREDERKREKWEKEREIALIKEIIEVTNKNKEYFETLPVTEFEPFTIFEGGTFTIFEGGNRNYNCRYVTLPRDFDASKSKFGLVGDFYEEVDKDVKKTVDYVGYAIKEHGRLVPIGMYSLAQRNKEDSEELRKAKDYQEQVWEDAENNGKIVKIVGMSVESVMFSEKGTLQGEAEKLQDEMKKLS